MSDKSRLYRADPYAHDHCSGSVCSSLKLVCRLREALCPGERVRARASCGPSFFVAGGGREGHWSGVRAYFYIPKKRLLQSTLCGYSRSIAHISVWACLACVPDAEARGSIEERRGCPDALGARGRPLLLRAVPWVSLRAILVSALSIKSHAARPRRARHFWQVVRA